MTQTQLQNLISQKENQTLEFKESTGEKKEICETICAFANSDGGIILVGVKNNGRLSKAKITEKSQTDISDLFVGFKPPITSLISFETFYNFQGQNILIIKVKKANSAKNFYKKTCWKRVGASNKDITSEIINQITTQNQDWSSEICEGATIQDLDKEAIKKAKKQAIEKATGSKKEILQNCQTDLEFLDKARITKNGQITNTAMILLGKEERAFDLIPFSQALEIIWVDMLTGQKREGGKFYPPFILSVDDLASQIRISKHDYMERIGGQPTTNRKFVPQYELKSIREALHNCIAHQDYQDNKRVVMEEYADRLYFKNGGYSKISDEEYQKMITDTFTPQDYRNEFLVRAMDTINMIERLGSGQKSIFDYARKVFLPLPDRVSDVLKNRFEYTIYGSKIDEAFAQILQDRKDLDIGMVLLLDRVQKYAKGITDKQISRDQHKILKDQRLVEGRYPKLYLSAEIMEVLGKSEEYTKISMENDFRNLFEEAILRHINKFDEIQANQVYQFAMEKFSDLVKNKSESKIKSDINNSRQKLKKNGDIIIIKNGKKSVWKKP